MEKFKGDLKFGGNTSATKKQCQEAYTSQRKISKDYRLKNLTSRLASRILNSNNGVPNPQSKRRSKNKKKQKGRQTLSVRKEHMSPYRMVRELSPILRQFKKEHYILS